IILLVLLTITILAFLDRDLQTTVDMVKGWLEDTKYAFTDWKENRKKQKEVKSEQRKKERKKRKEKKKAEQQQKKVRQKQKAEQQMRQKSQQEPPTKASKPKPQEDNEPETIDETVERSHEQDVERRRRQKEEVQSLEQRPRAELENQKVEENDDVDISVYVGEGDEQAGDKELDRQNMDKAKEVPRVKYKFPTVELLDSPPNEGNEVDLDEIKENKRIILDKLKRHKIEIRSINAIVGPTVTLYELDPAPDVKISKIESYANDLKMATAAKGLRIMAPIPGRSAVGIEVPNGKRETVFIKSVINTKKFVESDY